MKVYRFECEQWLPLSMDEAWDFFSSPENLSKITPEHMRFEILNDVAGEKMYPGQLINYKVRPMLNIPLRWTTEITHVKEGHYFVDEQRFGPYALWHHKHFFKEKDGGVLMTDIVDYAIPFGLLGRLANALFVASEVRAIFDFRTEVLNKRFSSPSFKAEHPQVEV